jgi:hypothetical protein
MLNLRTRFGKAGAPKTISYSPLLTGDQIFQVAIRALGLPEIGSNKLFLRGLRPVEFVYLTRNDTLHSSGANETMELWILPPHEQPQWLIGPRLNSLVRHSSDFVERGVLGSGTYGIVHEAQDIRTRQRYARKTLLNCTSLAEKLKWSRELNLQAFVKHDAVTPLAAIDIDSDSPHFYMPYFANGSIRGYAVANLDSTQKMIILTGIASGMAHLHSLGIAHRDLKPGNILLDTHLRPVICDFGCANQIDPEHDHFSTSVIGTPGYIAPEVHAGEHYSFEVDYFAFGMTTYSIITGFAPSEGLIRQKGKKLSDYALQVEVLNGETQKLAQTMDCCEPMKVLVA